MKEHEDVQAQAAAWIAQRDRLGNAWTEDHERRLQAWLADDVSHRVAWLRLQAAWQRADHLEELSVAPVVWTPRARSHSMPRWMPLAVLCVLALVLVPMGLQLWRGHAKPDLQVFSTPVGGQAALAFEDGSHVTLNTRTQARAAINANSRQFWLDEGEAFFDIRRAGNKPFVVIAGSDRITVLGTKFSVRHESGQTRVNVIEGRVRVDRIESSGQPLALASAELERNKSAFVRPDAVLVVSRSEQQMQQDLGWRQGRLTFEQLTLAEVAAEFNRYSRRQLVVEGPAASLRIGGSFDATNVDGFVRLVQQGFGVVVREHDDRIHLSLN